MIRSSLVVAAGCAAVTASMALLPAEALAQRRAVVRPAVRPVVVVAARPRPVFLPPFYLYGGHPGWYRTGYGWYGWSPYGYYAQPFPYRHYYYDYSGAARILVQPNHAEVFIDGYFVGIVDDFDGWSQRLRVAPGERELAIHLDGYRTFRQKVLFRPGATLRIEHVMEPLQAGEAAEARPAPTPAPAPSVQPPMRQGYPVPSPRRGAPRPPPVTGESQVYGALAIRVQPADAEVIVNGERWESPEAGDLTLQLSEGTHRVEVRQDGFRTYEADVNVRRGETTTLNVSLSRQ